MSGSGLTAENPKASDFAFNVAAGNVNGVVGVGRIGFNPDIVASPEDLWNAGGLMVYLTAAETMDIVSDNAADTSVGTGLQTLLIQGLDDNFVETSETITLDGLNPVTTVNTYLRVHDMRGLTAGATGSNEGIITATATTSVVIQGQMDVGSNASSTFQFTVPADKTAFITFFEFSAGQMDAVEFSIFVRLEGGLFQQTSKHELVEDSLTVTLMPYTPLPEKTDLRCLAERVAGGGSTLDTAIVRFYLVDNQ
ncbi:hypothetical protein LCGC14_1035590 [marine sediment metagenome]|uniref:Uncharacterized protein n=1 Tax=marine sediment metagenome TaxID=412755 RepID=A0A0F9MXY7_9ZZZZ